MAAAATAPTLVSVGILFDCVVKFVSLGNCIINLVDKGAMSASVWMCKNEGDGMYLH